MAALPVLGAAASLNVYLSPPGQQSTYIAGAATETFNSLGPGIQTTPFQSTIGTYEFSPSTPVAVLAADQYGGAGDSNYIALGAESGSSAPFTLQLNSPATYFGFWWSAGDRHNGLTFYYNDTLLAHLTTNVLLSILSSNNGVVTAVNGTAYSQSEYYGNPNNRLDGGEPFAYVDVFAANAVFNKVVFDNSGFMNTGFESDNHSVYLGATEPERASVFVESAPTIQASPTPEPRSLALAGAGVLGLALLHRRQRYR